MKKNYYQCQNCGYVHYIENAYNIDVMYKETICPKCDKVNTHLWVGNDPLDFYLYADNYLDDRYFY